MCETNIVLWYNACEILIFGIILVNLSKTSFKYTNRVIGAIVVNVAQGTVIYVEPNVTIKKYVV